MLSYEQKLRDKTLAGKKAVFDVEVLSASKRIVPEVTDEFAAKVRAGLTEESLMAELRKAIDQEDVKEYAPARNKALADALAEVCDVEAPDTLVTNQAREKFAVFMADMREGGVSDEAIKKQITPENFNKYKEIVKGDIVKDFKVSLATSEISRVEGITVPDYQVEEQMEAIRKDATQNKEEYDEKLIRGKVEATMLQQAVYDWLAENSNLEVEYEGEDGEDGEDDFDEQLMQQLAEESLEREKKMAEEALQGDTTNIAQAEPVVEVSVEPVVEVSAEQVVEASTEPVVEASTEPVAEASTEPVAQEVETVEVVEKTDSTPEDAVLAREETADVVADPEPKKEESAEAQKDSEDRSKGMSFGDKAFQFLSDLGLMNSNDDKKS